jgi:hypothetical protein
MTELEKVKKEIQILTEKKERLEEELRIAELNGKAVKGHRGYKSGRDFFISNGRSFYSAEDIFIEEDEWNPIQEIPPSEAFDKMFYNKEHADAIRAFCIAEHKHRRDNGCNT